MNKGVKWVTLTAEERRMVQPPSPRSAAGGGENGSLLKHHVCKVHLPDQTICQVRYQRDAAQGHRFEFTAPLHERLNVNERLPNSVEAIEAKAQALAAQAYAQAQQSEQKAMQRRTSPPGPTASLCPSGLFLRARTAQAQAGRYTVCVAFPSGNLMPIGHLHTRAETAIVEWEQEVHRRAKPSATQPLVVRICCRWQRRWLRAQFVVYPPQCQPTAAASVTLPHPRPEPQAEPEATEEAEPMKEASDQVQTQSAPPSARSRKKRAKQAGNKEPSAGIP